MKKTRKPKSAAMAAALEAAQDRAAVGLITAKTMRGYEELCAVPDLTAVDRVRIRSAVHASQGHLARALNVRPSTVQQWESRKKKPSGVAAKILRVVKQHGLANWREVTCDGLARDFAPGRNAAYCQLSGSTP